MKKRGKNNPNAELIALLTSIRDQIDETLDDLGFGSDDDDDDCDDDNGEGDD